MSMNYERFVNEVAERAGSADRTVTERAIVLTIRALGRRLRTVDARAVARELPNPLGSVLLESSGGEECDLADFQRRIENGAPPALVRAACRVLVESLDEQART